MNIVDNIKEPLPQEEIVELFKQYRSGNEDAYIELIEHNLKLVLFCIKRYFMSIKCDREDLYSAGKLGLIKAINNYDVNKKVNFSSYCCQCIYNQILSFIREMNNNVLEESLEQKIGDNRELLEIINSGVDITLNLDNKELMIIIEKIIEELNDKEKEVIKLSFGFYGVLYSLKEIAKKVKLPTKVVTNVISGALLKIEKKLQEYQGISEKTKVLK